MNPVVISQALDLIAPNLTVPPIETVTLPEPMTNTSKPVSSSSGTWVDRWLKLQPVSEEIVAMSKAVEKWAKAAIQNKASWRHLFVLCGKNGTGKTMCLDGVHDYFKASRVTLWELRKWERDLPELTRIKWHKIAALDRFDDVEIFEDVTRPELCLLDDVGSECDRFKSGLPTSNLAYILDARRDKWTFITTNVLPEEWSAHWDRRVADRLHRNSVIITIRTTPSFALR